MKKYDIYGIGAALVDMEFEVSDDFLKDHQIEKGQMTLVDPENQYAVIGSIQENQIKTRRASGGSAANTVFAASNFGSSNYYSCKTAQDEAGEFFIRDMQQAGIDCTPNQNDMDLPTGTCLVMITPDAERTMNTYLAISEHLSSKELNPEALKHANYLYMEGYLATSDSGRNAAIEARKIAQANNTKIVLTFSDPAMVKFFKPQINEMLGEKVDLLFCNEQEALIWSEAKTLDGAISALKQVSQQFVITQGAKGAYVFDGEQGHDIASHPVKAVDTNGAGDMFAGAFLYAISKGHDFVQAGKLASAASAKVVSQFGPRLAMDDHKALLAHIN